MNDSDPRQRDLAAALDRLTRQGLRRRHRLVEAAQPPGRTVVHRERDGRARRQVPPPLINLSSNDYLGFATDERVIAAATDALARYGCGATASRLVTGHAPVHAELEAKLAQLKQQEAALVLPTGYAANLAVLTSLAGPRDLILADQLNHASLIDGCRLSGATVRRFPHRDLEVLRERLAEEGPGCRGRILIVTDGVFSMDGDVAPLPELAALAEEYGAWLVVDDAHGTGVLGEGGAGTAEHFGLKRHAALIHIGTLSKALGSQGGFVAGPRVLIDFLLNTARSHIFTTGLAPACAAAASAALDLVATEPQRRARLHELRARLRQGLVAQGYALAADDAGLHTPILPVHVGEAEAAVHLSERLAEHGVLAAAIRPPAVPPGAARLRLTVMATHSDEQLTTVLDAFAAVAG